MTMKFTANVNETIPILEISTFYQISHNTRKSDTNTYYTIFKRGNINKDSLNKRLKKLLRVLQDRSISEYINIFL